MTFSTDEKTIIGHILEMDRLPGPNCLTNIWERVLPDVRINFKNKAGGGVPGQVFVAKEVIDNPDLKNFDKQLTSTTLLIIDLFDRLEKKKYILLFNPDKKQRVLGNDSLETEGVGLTMDTAIRRRLAILTRKKFRVSQSLHDLAENDYMSDEALRFKKTIKKERIALGGTFLALIISLLGQIPAWIQFFSDKPAKVELTSESQVQTSIMEEPRGHRLGSSVTPPNTEADIDPPPARSATNPIMTLSNDTVASENQL